MAPMEAAEEILNGSGDEEEEVEEEIEEEVEEEVEEIEEEEEEEEGLGEGDGGDVGDGDDVGDADGGDGEDGERGEDGGVGGETRGKGLDNVDSASEEIKHHDSGSSSAGKIFVGGVAWETTEDTFAKHFSKYGEIIDSVIMKDKHTQKPRGFGFITFADPANVDKVLEEGHIIDGRTVEVKRTVPREDIPTKGGPKTRKIFVGGIPPSLTEDELKEHFSFYGKVVEHQIMLDHSSGRSRGFGFVTFETEDAVEKVISEGKMHDLGGKKVEIKKAEPKKAGGDPGSTERTSYGAGGGHSYGMYGGAYGYGGGYRSTGMYYGARAGGGYGRGYGYGAGAGYGAGYAAGYGGSMYGAAGYGGGNGYGGPSGYSGAYGGYGAGAGAGAGAGGGRGYGSRYHPYGR